MKNGMGVRGRGVDGGAWRRANGGAVRGVFFFGLLR